MLKKSLEAGDVTFQRKLHTLCRIRYPSQCAQRPLRTNLWLVTHFKMNDLRPTETYRELVFCRHMRSLRRETSSRVAAGVEKR